VLLERSGNDAGKCRRGRGGCQPDAERCTRRKDMEWGGRGLRPARLKSRVKQQPLANSSEWHQWWGEKILTCDPYASEIYLAFIQFILVQNRWACAF